MISTNISETANLLPKYYEGEKIMEDNVGGLYGTKERKQACIQGVENCVLLGHYAESSGNFVPTFREK